MAHMALRFSLPRKEGGQAGGGAAVDLRLCYVLNLNLA